MTARLVLAPWLLALLPPALPAQDVYGGTRKAVDLGEYKGFVLEPPNPGPAGSRPWVWYAPVLGNNPGKANEWVLRQLLKDGFYVAGVNVGESIGNPAGRTGYTRFYDHVVKAYGLEPKARLLAQSRGGLMLYNWASEHPHKVRCIAGIYPVCDLRSYPKLPRAAEAYGMTVADLEKVLPEHNPVDRLGPLAKLKVPILHVHGDADKLVPLDKNSQALCDRYRALGGPAELIVVKGKGHEAVKEFFEEPRLVAFLKAGGFTDPPDKK
jgi:pimeloyl-ACP methyl ester carboxylesterase